MTDTQERPGPALWDAVPGKWNSDEDDTLICTHVRQETHDVKSFLFRSTSPKLFRFRPGQFITIEVEIGGETINRCYTISSPPTRPDTLSITVKRVPGGKVSNWLHENLKLGSAIKALGPSGEFSFTLHPARKYLFLSGGSGVTPLMSMSRTLYELGEDRDVVFVHSARTPRDIIFRNELTMMTHGSERFRTAFVCEQRGEHRDWSAPTGYLTLPLLKSIVPDLAEREIFCCGPEAYMTNVRSMLKDAGFDIAHYHEESFSFERLSPEEKAEVEEALAADAASGGFKIEFTKSGRTIDCRPDQFILDAAKAAGLRLPFSCSKGVCGTCKSKKLSGQVVMTHGGGIRQREIDAGMILICCSKPLSDVVVEK
ncbi:MAG: FAD-binding oxidoreductase [Hyphomicrobium sp.]|uniref:FAD-binding oxidoreductase n=1 Tax=Hyphomicrobium sp. TaxID=82 RepID=UPI0039E34977